MGLEPSFWARRRSDIGTAVSGEDNTITYDDCLDQVYNYIQKAHLDNQEMISEKSTTELNEFNKTLVVSYINDKRPAVIGFINNQQAEFTRLIAVLQDDIVNWGPITDAINDESITEIQINDYMSIYVERAGKQELLTDPLTGEYVTFKSPQELAKYSNKLLKYSNITLATNTAIQGGITPEGYRVAAVHHSAAAPEKGLNALAQKSAAIVIRKFSKTKYTLNDLINFGSLPTEAAEFIRRIGKASLPTIVAGPTGSGKTVLLQALVDERPPNMRMFTIEDQSELKARQRNEKGTDLSNTVQFEARPVPPGMTNVPLSFPSFENLIVQALRMSPHTFALGEIRTNSVITQAMVAANTGHPFYTTIHAEDTGDVLTRIAKAVVTESPGIPYNVVLEDVCSNIKMVLIQKKIGDQSRKLLEFAELEGVEYKDGRAVPKINMLFEFQVTQEGVDENGKIVGRFIHKNRISDSLKKKLLLAGLSQEDMKILLSGPAPGEEPLDTTMNEIELRG